MDLPIQFPDSQAETRARAEEFQRLSAAEQSQRLIDTIETGMLLIRESKDREAIDRLFFERELEWQNIQKKLIRRYVERTTTSSA